MARLELAGNVLGDGGGRAIAGAMETNSTLTTLELTDNGLGEGVVRALAAALERNSTLTFLRLEKNGLGMGDDSLTAHVESLLASRGSAETPNRDLEGVKAVVASPSHAVTQKAPES